MLLLHQFLSTSEPLFLHHDHLGNVIVASGADGRMVGRTRYTPLGAQKDTEGYLGIYGFTGQDQDASTDLLHFKFRFLDAKTGRWVSADPAFYRSTTKNFMKYGEATTAYAYVANRAINLNDPTGLATPAKDAQTKTTQNFMRKGEGKGNLNQKPAREQTQGKTKLENTMNKPRSTRQSRARPPRIQPRLR